MITSLPKILITLPLTATPLLKCSANFCEPVFRSSTESHSILSVRLILPASTSTRLKEITILFPICDTLPETMLLTFSILPISTAQSVEVQPIFWNICSCSNFWTFFLSITVKRPVWRKPSWIKSATEAAIAGVTPETSKSVIAIEILSLAQMFATRNIKTLKRFIIKTPKLTFKIILLFYLTLWLKVNKIDDPNGLVLKQQIIV